MVVDRVVGENIKLKEDYNGQINFMRDAMQTTETGKPLTSEAVLELLNTAELEYRVTHHKPLMTVEDAKSIRSGAESEVGQIKNLFVRNKKRKMWLLTLHEDRKIDLKQTAVQIGAGRFSFCSSERLMQYLGVIPGAVSPLALLNDVGCEVEFYVDEELLGHPVLHVHPLDNRSTVTIGCKTMLDFLGKRGHPHRVLTF